METGNNIKPKSKGTLVILIAASVVFLLALIPGVYAAMMSVMMFDAPGSEEKISVVGFFYSMVSFPVLCVLSNISWLFYARKKNKLAVIAALSPLLSFIAIFASAM